MEPKKRLRAQGEFKINWYSQIFCLPTLFCFYFVYWVSYDYSDFSCRTRLKTVELERDRLSHEVTKVLLSSKSRDILYVGRISSKLKALIAREKIRKISYNTSLYEQGVPCSELLRRLYFDPQASFLWSSGLIDLGERDAKRSGNRGEGNGGPFLSTLPSINSLAFILVFVLF